MNLFSSFYEMHNFVVKEKKNWTLYAVPASTFFWMFYIIFIIIIFSIIFLNHENYSDDIFEYIFDFILICIFIGTWANSLNLGLEQKKAKNLKHKWIWIVKKLKINEIAKARVYVGKGSNFNVICVKARDWDTSYYSNAHTKWKISGVSQTDLEKIYNSYWFTYDEKQSQQKDLLNFLDWEISKTEYDIQNSWLFKRIKIKRTLKKLNNERQTIETWYIPQFWEINWNKISVWDSVDVYIDPNNPDIYRVDIDFLFDK